MRIAVTGSSGFIGRHAVNRLARDGHEIYALSLRSAVNPAVLAGCDAVIHLAGEPVGQRWTAQARARIRSSRVDQTRELVAAMQSHPPGVLISASAVGYYGSRGNESLTEDSPPATDFLGTVCAEWEREAQAAERLGVRVVRLRFGIVLGRRGGALEKMLVPFMWGLGGRIGDGKQWMSWIHVDDVASLIAFALASDELNGAVNAVAPTPVTNSDFTRELGRALHRPAILPVPRAALRLLYGEMAEIIYGSQRAIPQAALRAGFEFRFPELGAALGSVIT